MGVMKDQYIPDVKCSVDGAALIDGKCPECGANFQCDIDEEGLPPDYLDTGVTEEEKPKRRFGEGSVCEGPDEVNM